VRWPGLIIFLALQAMPASAADADAVPSPRLPLEIGDVALADGRVMRSVVVLSQNGLAINVRHAGGLTKIEKRQLPPELLAQFPINEAQAAREEQAAREGLARREEKAQVASLWAVRAPILRGPRKFAAAAATPDPAAATKAAVDPGIASPAEQLARAPNGLYIATWSNRSGGEVTMVVANPTGSARKLEPRELVALRLDNGQEMPGSDVRFEVKERADQWVDAGQRRTFRVQFLGGVTIAAVSWAGSGVWRVSGPFTEAAAITNVDDAMALARANAKEARERALMEANKARAAKAIDKLDDRLIGK
jgi:hypothetical protein